MCCHSVSLQVACISLQVWASGLRASEFMESVLPEGISSQAEFWAEFSKEHTYSALLILVGSSEIRLRCCLFSLLLGSPGTIASEGSDIPQIQWTCANRLCQGDTLVIQPDQYNVASMEEMMCQLQENMKIMQQDAARQVEFAKQQAEVIAQQAELIARLQQQIGASASHQAPPPPRMLILGKTTNVQEDTDIPTGPAPSPILPQLSKAPTPTNLPDSPFEFKTDPTALKVSKLEKLFKKSQGVKSILDIEDGYTNATVTLPDRFKMPHIDRFDGSGDPMVHLRLFSDILRPMGLTRLQKLSLFGRTLSSVAAI
ncbi:hypothetical protein ACSBR1_030836 [Camellia fascicularis]